MLSLIGLVVLTLCVSTNAQSTDTSTVDYVCTDCVKLVDAVLSFMSDKPVQDSVVTFLDAEVCGRLNYDFTKDCTDQVEGFVPYLMYYMQTKIPKQQVCEAFSLCPYSTDSTPTPTPSPTKDLINSIIQGAFVSYPGSMPTAECQYCELAEGEISMLLQNEQAKNIVMQYLGQICNELPFNSVECENLLTLYIDQVFHILQGYLSDNEFCVEFELCPKAVDMDLVVE